MQQISPSSILLWVVTLIVFGFACFSLIKSLRSSKTLILDESIGIDVYSGIANKLVEDYDFVRFSDDNCIKNVNKLVFLNKMELQGLPPCEMKFDVSNCDAEKCAVQNKGYLFRVTGTQDPLASFSIPDNDYFNIGLSGGNPSAPVP